MEIFFDGEVEAVFVFEVDGDWKSGEIQLSCRGKGFCSRTVEHAAHILDRKQFAFMSKPEMEDDAEALHKISEWN